MKELEFYELGENYQTPELNEDENPRNFDGILEQAGLMSDSLLSVQGLSQGMLISYRKLKRSALGCIMIRASPGQKKSSSFLLLLCAVVRFRHCKQ